MVSLVRCVPVSVLFSDLLKSWGGGGCDGTHMLPQGHSIVYKYVDMGTCARYRSCLCHIVCLAGKRARSKCGGIGIRI